MPQHDHKGPEGKGPMTGRKLGLCRVKGPMEGSTLASSKGKSQKMKGRNGLRKGMKSKANQE
jgi:hypothetical protein